MSNRRAKWTLTGEETDNFVLSRMPIVHIVYVLNRYPVTLSLVLPSVVMTFKRVEARDTVMPDSRAFVE